MTQKILDGIRVLDQTIYQFGPINAVMLAAMGAEVIKIEAPVGDPGRTLGPAMPGSQGKVPFFPNMTAYFETCNHGKKGIVLDLKKPKAKEILYELVAKSDVFINNMRLGVAARLGADYESLKKYNPKLIYCASNAFGFKGPDASKPGFDFSGAARAGVFFCAPTEDGSPIHSLSSSYDQEGGIHGAFAIVAALLARERYGIGQKIELSHLSSTMWLMGTSLQMTLSLKLAETLAQPRSRAANPMMNHYQCADEQWIALAGVDADRHWPTVCQAVGIPESIWKDDPRFNTRAARQTNAKDTVTMLDKIFAQKTRDEWMHIFEGKDIFWEKVQRIEDLPNDPQVTANEYLTEYTHPITGETYKYLMQPFSFSETPATIKGRAPMLGEHTEEVLVNILGYKKEDVPQLLDEIGRPMGKPSAAK